jgi:hypothetical protein
LPGRGGELCSTTFVVSASVPSPLSTSEIVRDC